MSLSLSEKGRAALDGWRALSGFEPAGLSGEWRDMSEQEREFWLRASRLSTRYAGESVWFSLPGDVRATLKNNLYRAAKRAAMILS